MTYIIAEKNGKLYVLDEWQTSDATPYQNRNYWPTGILAKDYPDFIGMSAYSFAPGIYRLSNGKFIELVNGGNARPEYIDSRPIKKPRGKTIYQYGKWRK